MTQALIRSDAEYLRMAEREIAELLGEVPPPPIKTLSNQEIAESRAISAGFDYRVAETRASSRAEIQSHRNGPYPLIVK